MRRRLPTLGSSLLLAAVVIVTAASAASDPAVGLRSDPGVGFGLVKPRAISLGRAPTQVIGHIRWASWGAPQATGYGAAIYTPPGSCAGCAGERLEATVVAYDPASCQGHQIYEYVGWYFPTRSQHFSGWLGATNLCTGRAHPPPASLVAPHDCAGTYAIRGTADRVSSLVTKDISCGSAAQTLVSLDAQRHLGRSSEYYAPPWYCGSSLSSETTPGLQPFVCLEGDFHVIRFDLSR